VRAERLSAHNTHQQAARAERLSAHNLHQIGLCARF